ncbi:MAG: monofunctional biosynthetic peptidoglycan transglycosylase [Pseudomonadota bacterium]
MVAAKKWKPWSAGRWILKRMAWIFLAGIFVTVIQVMVFRVFNPPITVSTIWDYAWSMVENEPYQVPAYKWRDLAGISPHLRRAVLASEDQRFLDHGGFDFTELSIAVKDIMEEHRVRGASTISMQAARSLFLVPSRSLVRKAAEAWYTLLMELFWNKKRILEIYLNTVDWGTGIMGAEAAANRYFNRSSQHLTREESALMAAVLPSPHRWLANRPDQHVLLRQKRILRDMEKMTIP